MAKSVAQFSALDAVNNVVNVGTITQVVRVGVTMVALKAALPDYYNAPSLGATLAQSFDASRKYEFAAQALTRLALNAAHSGTVPDELTRVSASLAESAKGSKGAAKAELNRVITALDACGAVISAAKNTLKSASITAFETFAIECECEFVAYLTPIKVDKAPKPTATKSALEKIIALIQSATLSADDVTALRAALDNVTATESAPF